MYVFNGLAEFKDVAQTLNNCSNTNLKNVLNYAQCLMYKHDTSVRLNERGLTRGKLIFSNSLFLHLTGCYFLLLLV